MPLPPDAFLRIVDQANDAVLITEAEPLSLPGPRIVYANAAMCRLCGYEAEELLGATPRLLQGPLTDPAALARIHEALADGRELTVELMNYHRAASPYWVELRLLPLRDESGGISHFAAISRDITDALGEQDGMYRMAVSDGITRLYSRQMFFDVGGKLMQLSFRQHAPLMAALLSLDDMPRIRETYGQMVSSLVFRVVGQALRRSVRDSDIVGRLDACEFSAILPDVQPETASQLLARIGAQLADSYRLAGLPDGARARLSMGMALLQPEDDDLSQMLARARAGRQPLRGEAAPSA
nr:diguanylate cyclase [Chromobacterium sp. ASV5]